MALLEQFLRQFPEKIGQERAAVPPEERGKWDRTATKGTQLAEQRGHERRMARMPHGNHERRVVSVLLRRGKRRQDRQSVYYSPPEGGIIIGKSDRIEIRARETPAHGKSQAARPEDHESPTTGRCLIESSLLANVSFG